MQIGLKRQTSNPKVITVGMFGVILLALALSACTNPKQQLAQQMNDGAQQQSTSEVLIEPLAETAVIVPYVYQATNQRSPFAAVGLRATVTNRPQSQTQTRLQSTPLLSPQSQLAQSDMPAPIVQGPLPDASRPRQPLEAYDLSQLIYRGMIIIGQEAYGLVQRPEGLVLRVQVGDYMGSRSGRIVEMTATQINLVETVFDPQLGYKPASASLIAPVLLQ